MFDAPADAWYVWLGVAVASVTVAGVALELPDSAPPDAAAAANAIDRAAGSEYRATARYEHDAAAVAIGTDAVSLRGDGGTARASLAFGPVTPVAGDEDLEAVLYGASPERTFDSRTGFARALESARADARSGPEWQRSPGPITVRTVSWGDERATLVGA